VASSGAEVVAGAAAGLGPSNAACRSEEADPESRFLLDESFFALPHDMNLSPQRSHSNRFPLALIASAANTNPRQPSTSQSTLVSLV